MPIGDLRNQIGRRAAPPVNPFTHQPVVLNNPSGLQEMTIKALALDNDCDLDKIAGLISAGAIPGRLGALVLRQAISLYNTQTSEYYKSLKAEIEHLSWSADQAVARTKEAQTALLKKRKLLAKNGTTSEEYDLLARQVKAHIRLYKAGIIARDRKFLDASQHHMKIIKETEGDGSHELEEIEGHIAVLRKWYEDTQQAHDELIAPIAKEGADFAKKVDAYLTEFAPNPIQTQSGPLNTGFKDKPSKDAFWEGVTEYAVEITTVQSYARRVKERKIGLTLEKQGIVLPAPIVVE